MAYRRRRTTRRSSARTGYSRGRTYTARRSRRTTRSRRSSVSRRPQTVRIVVQTVGATPTNQSSVVPLRAMF